MSVWARGEFYSKTYQTQVELFVHCSPSIFSAFSLSGQFDSNGDGQISLTELREAMKKLMGEQVTNREINEILRDVDLNGDGLVDFEGETNFLCLYRICQVYTFISLPLTHLFFLIRVCANDVPLTGAGARM